MKKILVSDYDQTFYIGDEDIEKNKIAVNRFRNKGNIFIIATGRSYEDFMGKKKTGAMPTSAPKQKKKMVIDMTKVELAKAYQAPGFRTGKHMTVKDRPRKKDWKREYEKEKGSGKFSGGSSKGGSSDDRTGSFFIGQQSA